MTPAQKNFLVKSFFAVLFLVFFGIWCPRIDWHLTGFDEWELVHDFYYRSDIFRIFDFQMLTYSRATNTYYMPLLTSLFDFSYSLSGGKTAPFYFFCFLMHGANAVIVYALAQMTTGNKAAGILSTFMFMFHPANIPTTAWLAGIYSHTVSAFLYLLSLCFFIRFIRKKGGRGKQFFYLGCFSTFFAACLIKVLGLVLIPLFFLLEILLDTGKPPMKKAGSWQAIASWFDKYIPFFLSGLFFAGVAVLKYPNGSIARDWGGVSFSEFSLFRIMEFITWFFSPLYMYSNHSVNFVLLALVLTGIFLIWGDGKIRFLTVWTLLSLAPFSISNFRPLPILWRYLYHATVPLSILTACLAVYFCSWFKQKVPLGNVP